jgi:hypothetical protein
MVEGSGGTTVRRTCGRAGRSADGAHRTGSRAFGPAVCGPKRDGEEDVAWVHFRAPDGNIYGITQGRDLEPEP